MFGFIFKMFIVSVGLIGLNVNAILLKLLKLVIKNVK